MPSSDHIGSYSVTFLLSRAADIVKKKTANSTIFDQEAEDRLPKFQRPELVLGRVLGRGGFCTVNEIKNINLTDSKSGDHVQKTDERGGELQYDGGTLVQDRAFMARRCIREGKDARYAIKHLSDEVLKDPERFVAGVIDLAIEARFLAVIQHPNIIKMRAAAIGNPYEPGYFVVLDRLYDTLSARIVKWKKEKGKVSGIAKIRDMKGAKKKELFTERLLVGYDLSSALRYLHSINIVYRDLKPDNIGFDVRGDVKLFDFGLAKEILPEHKVADDMYKLSGNTGSLRYMAPEVFYGKPYNFTVDVYSFGIILWQILSLATPFSGYSLNMHNDLVLNKGGRPKLDPSWSKRICDLLTRSWSVEISDRPSMMGLTDIMRDEVNELMGEEQTTLDASSRTANSVRGA